MTWVVLAVMLFCDRDVAPIFGHLSPLAGGGSETAARLGVAALALALPGVAQRACDARRGDALRRSRGSTLLPGPSSSASTRR